MDNKAKSLDFLHLVTSGWVKEAYQKHVHRDFIHHNPFFKGDRESLLIAEEENTNKNPNVIFQIHRSLAEGDLVAVHSHIRFKPDDLGIAVVHIFRFYEGLIIELWDIGQQITDNMQNENGMF